MKKISFIVVVTFSVILYGFDLMMSAGYSYGSPTGWLLGIGAAQDSFEGNLFVTFYMANNNTMFEFNVNSYIPIFGVGPFSIGGAFNVVKGNYGGGRERACIGGGFRIYTSSFSLLASAFYPIYPDGSEYDALNDLYIDLRYFLKPPAGMHFKDKLFFFITYSSGFYRVGAGLLEPVP